MCFFKAPKVTTQAVTPTITTQAALTPTEAPTPESPVFGADDDEGEASSSMSSSKTGISSLKIKKTTTENVAGANLQLKTTGIKVK